MVKTLFFQCYDEKYFKTFQNKEVNLVPHGLSEVLEKIPRRGNKTTASWRRLYYADK